MKIKHNNLFWLLGLILVFSCETTELDLLVDPNVPTPETLNEDGSLNFIQFNLAEFFEEATEAGAETVRLEYMFDTYEVNFSNTNVNTGGMWRIGYADILNEIQALIPIATNSSSHRHIGVARIIKAYTLMTLVDYFGDVPLTEALQGDSGIVFPTVDPASDVYEAAFDELDLALADFANITGTTPNMNDLYFGEDSSLSMDKWTKLANTLKLRYYLSRRLIDQAGSLAGINTILTSGNFITTSAESFTWTAGTAGNPQSKHQYYVEEYEAANTGEYIPNYLMWALTEEKGAEDPRLRYYVYRQTNSFPSDPSTLDNEISCWNDPRPTTYAPIDAMQAVPLPFCSLFGRGDGFWGRDHANREGIPPDNTKRTTFGVYPVGGRFDDNDGARIRSGEGLNGAGIWPIMMDSFVYFMRAEAALYLSTSDDAAVMLEQGIRSSMNTVIGFLPNPGDFNNTSDASDVNSYVVDVMASYTAAANDEERMAIIGKEYWLAMYGNGVEGYNLYRRTGAPGNLQPTLLGTGSFPRSFLYPSNTVDRNLNITQKPGLTEQVFWDNNPAGFIQ